MDATTEREQVDLRAEPAGSRREENGPRPLIEADEAARLENSQAAGLIRLARQIRLTNRGAA